MQKIKVNPKTAALLVIDMQNGFVEQGAVFCIAGAKKTTTQIGRASCRERV